MRPALPILAGTQGAAQGLVKTPRLPMPGQMPAPPVQKATPMPAGDHMTPQVPPELNPLLRG